MKCKNRQLLKLLASILKFPALQYSVAAMSVRAMCLWSYFPTPWSTCNMSWLQTICPKFGDYAVEIQRKKKQFVCVLSSVLFIVYLFFITFCFACSIMVDWLVMYFPLCIGTPLRYLDKDVYEFEERGLVKFKGREEEMHCWFLERHRTREPCDLDHVRTDKRLMKLWTSPSNSPELGILSTIDSDSRHGSRMGSRRGSFAPGPPLRDNQGQGPPLRDNQGQGPPEESSRGNVLLTPAEEADKPPSRQSASRASGSPGTSPRVTSDLDFRHEAIAMQGVLSGEGTPESNEKVMTSVFFFYHWRWWCVVFANKS